MSGGILLPRVIKKEQKKDGRDIAVYKGDLAPSHYKLMKCTNVAKINLEFFRKSKLSFVGSALGLLSAPHFDTAKLGVQHKVDLTNLSVAERMAKLRGTVDSSSYANLTGEMTRVGLIREIDITESALKEIIILKMFAVVKDVSQTLARPIENGRPVRTEGKEKFTLAGATQITKILRETRSEGMSAFHFDLDNCYFQYRNDFPMMHGFRCGDAIFTWQVLTMGWDYATRICQSLTMDITLRGALGVPTEITSSAIPPGVVHLENGCKVFCVYDSVLVLDRMQALSKWSTRVEENRREAHASFKYAMVQPFNTFFEYCGFEMFVSLDGIQWRIAKTTLDPWLERTTCALECTRRSLWRLLGFLTFAYTVLGVSSRLLGGGRHIQANCGLVTDAEWDIVDDTLEECISDLTRQIRNIKNVRQHYDPRKRCRNDDPRILRVVSDASKQKWCFYVVDHSGQIIDQGEGPASGDIAESEAIGVAEGILRIRRLVGNNSVIVLAGDNISVMRGFAKGYAASKNIHAQIVRSKIAEIEGVVIVVDVSTDDNLADIGTRPDRVYSGEEEEFRRRRTIERMEAGLELWILHGTVFVSRHAEVEEAVQEEVET